MKKTALLRFVLFLAYRTGIVKSDIEIGTKDDIGIFKEGEKKPDAPAPAVNPDPDPIASAAADMLKSDKPDDKKPPEGAPQFDFEKEFGKKPEEIKEVLSKYNEIMESNKTLTEKASMVEKLQKDIEEQKNIRHIKDDNLFRLNALYEKDKSQAETVGKILYGGVNDIDLLKMDFIKKNPEYKDNDKYVDDYIKAKFRPLNLMPERVKKMNDEGEEVDVEDANAIEHNKSIKLLAEQDMKSAAREARNSLLSDFNSIQVPKELTKEELDVKAKEKETELSQLASSWKKPFDGLRTTVASIKVEGKANLPDGKQTDVAYDFEIPTEMVSKYLEEGARYVLENRMPMTEENVDFVNNYVRYRYVNENLHQLFFERDAKVRAMSEEEYRNYIHNPSIKASDKAPAPKTDVEKRKEGFGKLFNAND